MKVSDLIPNLYKNNLEMNNIIYSEENEFENNLKSKIDITFNNTFISKANEKGISNFENMLNIKPNISTETIEFRRERVISRLVSQIPYTERFLINKLNSMLGKGNWNYKIDYNNYTLTIESLIPGRAWYLELLEFLKSIIPCNIDWQVIIYSASWNIVKDHFSKWNDLSSMTWEEVMNGEWLIN